MRKNTTGHNSVDNKQKIHDIMSRYSHRRKLIDKLVSIFSIACVLAAIIPLGSILLEVIKNGASAISIQLLTQPPGAIGATLEDSGGIAPAIQGTLIVVGLASAIGVPIGILAGIYLSEFAPGNGLFPSAVRLFNDVLTGLPSVVIGIVGYITIVLTIGSFSVLAGAFSLSIIMIPIVVRITEETLKVVPNSIREAGYSLGISRWKITLFVVLKSAKSGVLTGIVLAISRIAGETAPLIMTILGTSLFFTSFNKPIDALPLRIWRLASQPYDTAHSQGWGAALLLIIIVLIASVVLRLIVQRKGFRVKTVHV
ncbi:MAG TPA: phosphate ABC transporter permease PstA [Nitrososphaeraceae archaeon]|nr:phosphate ABC transporter permease PstA [Nitrososphaeraceae archaeon]